LLKLSRFNISYFFFNSSFRSSDDPNRQRIICDLLLLLVRVKNNNLFKYSINTNRYDRLIKNNEKYFFSLSSLSDSHLVSYKVNKTEIPYVFLREEMNIDDDDVNAITTLSCLVSSSFSPLSFINKKDNLQQATASSPTVFSLNSKEQLIKSQYLHSVFSINQLLSITNFPSF
jgi:hypothetical protein